MRAARITLTAVALVATVTVAGCGVSGAGRPTTSGPSASAAGTSTPSSTPTPSLTPTPSATPTSVASSLTQAQVTAALLTAADLGAGWGPDTSGMFGDSSSSSKGATYAPASCAAAADALDGAGMPSSATGEVSFETLDTSKVVDETIDSVPGSTTADLAKLLAAIAACPKFTETDTDGTVVSYEMTGTALAGLGDAAAALRIVATSGGVSIPEDGVLVQVGQEQIGLLGLGYDTPVALLDIARAATAKVGGMNA